ncbi:hypothetical protein, partial [Cupriavidus pinatubonensis]|uniref:hypothetical protein n=1 Tax=Cupriavidus pinatubonensis TaxID=248026 RepID=UPI001CC6D2BD
ALYGSASLVQKARDIHPCLTPNISRRQLSFSPQRNSCEKLASLWLVARFYNRNDLLRLRVAHDVVAAFGR